MRGDLPKELSEREIQVMYLLGDGLSATQIAESMAISVKTVSTYNSRLIEKLGLDNHHALLVHAIKARLLVQV